MLPGMQASLSLGLRAHNNQGLFADHYLDHLERLQALDEWRQATGIDEAFRKIAHLYSDKAAHFNKRINEHQTEHDVIRPVLTENEIAIVECHTGTDTGARGAEQ